MLYYVYTPCMVNVLHVIHLTVRPSDRPTVCPSVRPTVRPSDRPSDRPSVHLAVRPSERFAGTAPIRRASKD